MSETWKMPTWMREVLSICGYDMDSIQEADECYEDGEIILSAIHSGAVLDISNIIDDLQSLRTAGLLLTPGENDMHARAYDQACKDLYRLRAENADLLENYKRADRGLRECCDSKERIRTENKKMQGFIEIVASCAGWQKDEGGNYMESNGVCPNCQDEARKILKALGSSHD